MLSNGLTPAQWVVKSRRYIIGSTIAIGVLWALGVFIGIAAVLDHRWRLLLNAAAMFALSAPWFYVLREWKEALDKWEKLAGRLR